MKPRHLESALRIGTCGWSWDEWEGTFYPTSMPAEQRLSYYARAFDTVEADSTFYHVPPAHVIQHWCDATPDNFVFCCKLPRLITHEHRLKNCSALVATFTERMNLLGPKLGCVLAQLPPSFRIDENERDLRHFVCALPTTTRWAIEFRNPGWHQPRISRLLREHGVAWVWHDLTDPTTQELAAFELQPVTTDFLYVRLLGVHSHAQGGGDVSPRPDESHPPTTTLRDEALDAWVSRIASVGDQTLSTVYIFSDNHYEGFAPATCPRIARRFGLEISLPSVESGADASDTATDQLTLRFDPCE